MLKNHPTNINTGKQISNQTISSPSKIQLFLGRIYTEIYKSMLVLQITFLSVTYLEMASRIIPSLLRPFQGSMSSEWVSWILLLAFCKTLAFSLFSETSPNSHSFPRVTDTVTSALAGAFQQGQRSCTCLCFSNIPWADPPPSRISLPGPGLL